MKQNIICGLTGCIVALPLAVTALIIENENVKEKYRTLIKILFFVIPFLLFVTCGLISDGFLYGFGCQRPVLAEAINCIVYSCIIFCVYGTICIIVGMPLVELLAFISLVCYALGFGSILPDDMPWYGCIASFLLFILSLLLIGGILVLIDRSIKKWFKNDLTK